MVIAANKCDMYESEEVDQSEGESIAKELGAIFQMTSAKFGDGVEELFKKMGKKFISRGENEKTVNEPKGQKLEKSIGKNKEKNKKNCC